MKHLRTILVLAFGLLLSLAAFAADNNAVNVTVNNNTNVNGTTLKPGAYKVFIDRNGENVQARFVSGGKTVVTTSGHFESRAAFPSEVSLVVNGSDRALQQIVVQKMKGAVVIDNGAAASAGH